MADESNSSSRGAKSCPQCNSALLGAVGYCPFCRACIDKALTSPSIERLKVKESEPEESDAERANAEQLRAAKLKAAELNPAQGGEHSMPAGKPREPRTSPGPLLTRGRILAALSIVAMVGFGAVLAPQLINHSLSSGGDAPGPAASRQSTSSVQLHEKILQASKLFKQGKIVDARAAFDEAKALDPESKEVKELETVLVSAEAPPANPPTPPASTSPGNASTLGASAKAGTNIASASSAASWPAPHASATNEVSTGSSNSRSMRSTAETASKRIVPIDPPASIDAASEPVRPLPDAARPQVAVPSGKRSDPEEPDCKSLCKPGGDTKTCRLLCDPQPHTY